MVISTSIYRAGLIFPVISFCVVAAMYVASGEYETAFFCRYKYMVCRTVRGSGGGMSEFEIGESAYDWDETQEVEDAQKKNAEVIQERAKAYHHLFGQDPIGQRILGEWINLYCTGGVPSGSATERQCAMRDGKQELIQHIIQQIHIATGENQ